MASLAHSLQIGMTSEHDIIFHHSYGPLQIFLMNFPIIAKTSMDDLIKLNYHLEVFHQNPTHLMKRPIQLRGNI